MAWILKVAVEAIEIEQGSALAGGQPRVQIKRGLALHPFEAGGESLWGAWESAEKKVTEDLLLLLEPPPLSLGVH